MNLGLINILLKGRSSSLPAGRSTEQTMKWRCNEIIYDILENGFEKYSNRTIEEEGGTIEECTIDVGGSIPYYHTIKGCDCSDPENYNFYDAGRF